MARASKTHEMRLSVEKRDGRGIPNFRPKATNRTPFLVVPTCISTHR